MIDLQEWLRVARPGDRIAYHFGNLAEYRGMYAMTPERQRTEAVNQMLGVAREAWALREMGLVELAQKRHAEGDYTYLAIRTKRGAPR